MELMTLCYKDPGVHGFCVAIEGGSWLVQECEVFFLVSYFLMYRFLVLIKLIL